MMSYRIYWITHLLFSTYLQIAQTQVRPNNKAKCTLFSSELGPDWYKVPRPTPTQFQDSADYEKSYIHMPCAVTTVFDVGVCGCTNLVNFIYSAIQRPTSKEDYSLTSKTDKPNRPADLVKYRDPKDYMPITTSPPVPAGSLLVNIRTGELRKCPHRSSSHGRQWYLIREPTGSWRPMKCAPGTLFQKRSCTCVHQALVSKNPSTPEDSDILVIEEAYNGEGEDNIISQSLGISISDIDFRDKSADTSIPFWRRKINNDLTNNKQDDEDNEEEDVKPDVLVTLNNGKLHEIENGDTDEKTLENVDVGKDSIAEQHRRILLNQIKGPGPLKKLISSPLSIDTMIENGIARNDLKDNLLSPEDQSALLVKPKVDDGLNADTHVNNAGMNRDKVNDIGKGTIGNTEYDNKKKKKEKIASILNGMVALLDDKEPKEEDFFADQECQKRPLPEMGAQYFQLFIWGIGYVPYTCHGNRIYSDEMCSCVSAPADSMHDEDSLIFEECPKKALPKLGSQYFETYLWGVGFIPYTCHGDRIFSQKRCACVIP